MPIKWNVTGLVKKERGGKSGFPYCQRLLPDLATLLGNSWNNYGMWQDEFGVLAVGKGCAGKPAAAFAGMAQACPDSSRDWARK